MYRIYNFIDDKTIYECKTLVDIIIYINTRSDLLIDECYIQYYDGDLNEWENF